MAMKANGLATHMRKRHGIIAQFANTDQPTPHFTQLCECHVCYAKCDDEIEVNEYSSTTSLQYVIIQLRAHNIGTHGARYLCSHNNCQWAGNFVHEFNEHIITQHNGVG